VGGQPGEHPGVPGLEAERGEPLAELPGQVQSELDQQVGEVLHTGAGRARRTLIHQPTISWRGNIVAFRDRSTLKSGGTIVPDRPVATGKGQVCSHG
jgi:hypothetical protein